MPIVRCIDPERAARWIRDRGTDTLPVLADPPDASVGRYWIDFRRLSKEERLAVARVTADTDGKSIDDIMYQITRYGLPIEDNGDLVLIEDDNND